MITLILSTSHFLQHIKKYYIFLLNKLKFQRVIYLNKITMKYNEKHISNFFTHIVYGKVQTLIRQYKIKKETYNIIKINLHQ